MFKTRFMPPAALGALFLGALFGPSSHAQQQSLLMTTLDTEFTLSGSSGTSLRVITPEDVATVTPNPAAFYSAESFFTQVNWNTQFGDEDGDTMYYENPLAGDIDALNVCPLNPPDIRQVYISTSIQVGSAACGNIMRPGDVAALRPNGNMKFLIKENQIRTAFSISPNSTVNVDAVAARQGGDIFLSLEDDVFTVAGGLILDGAILFIPGPAINYDASGCTVMAVVPGSGTTALSEPQVDAYVANAMVSNNMNMLAGPIGDTDGLSIDPNGGTFGQPGGFVYPNVFFCGEGLTGCGVLSTAAGGSIATLNGMQLAVPFGSGPTLGPQVGLFPTPARSLNGLSVTPPSCRFVLDTTTPVVLGPGVVNLTSGGADPGAPVLFILGVGTNAMCGAQSSTAVGNPCFPDYYFAFIAPIFGPILVSDGAGFINVNPIYGGGVPPGITLVLQGVTPKGPFMIPALSAPMTLQF